MTAMHLSHRYRFVFIAVSHAASTSVGRLLAPYSDVHSVRRHLATPENPFFHHISAVTAKQLFDERGWEWDGYRRFCIVRNPYDRMVSMYHFGKRVRWPRGGLFSITLRRLAGAKARVGRPFREFVLSFDPAGDHFISLRRFICDESGKALVEDVLRFEDLRDALPKYLRSLGVPLGPTELEHANPSPERRSYREYYDDETRQRVEALFAYEFERFGYTF